MHRQVIPVVTHQVVHVPINVTTSFGTSLVYQAPLLDMLTDVDKEEFVKQNGGRPYRRRTVPDDHVLEQEEKKKEAVPSFVTA